MLRSRIKTVSTILMVILTLTIVNSSALAQDATVQGPTLVPGASESYLKEILNNVNNLPAYLKQLSKMALSWLAPDNSETTANLQNSFTSLFNAKLQNAQTQLNSQQKFLTAFLGHLKSINTSSENDITYPTLLNQPDPDPPLKIDPPIDPDPAYNYTQYAAGLNMRHSKPLSTWIPDKQHPAIAMYSNYYNTTSAVQTYNGYILSELYADAKNNNLSKQTQDSLIQQASDSKFFIQIASENLGIVLRQILLYNSQTYVLLAQLLETQKKLLAAQAMNNALLIAVNLEAENRIYRKASGQLPI